MLLTCLGHSVLPSHVRTPSVPPHIVTYEVLGCLANDALMEVLLHDVALEPVRHANELLGVARSKAFHPSSH